jgi:hypothetical protein
MGTRSKRKRKIGYYRQIKVKQQERRVLVKNIAYRPDAAPGLGVAHQRRCVEDTVGLEVAQ